MLFLEISKKNRKYLKVLELCLVFWRRFNAFQGFFSVPATAFSRGPVRPVPVTR